MLDKNDWLLTTNKIKCTRNYDILYLNYLREDEILIKEK